MPSKPLEAHVDSQPGEVIEEFFVVEVPDPAVPLDQNQGETVGQVMVRLYGDEFNKPARRASVADKDAHPAEWAAFEEKAKAATADMPRPDHTLPPEEGEGLEKPPPGTDPPLGGSRKPLLPLLGAKPTPPDVKPPSLGDKPPDLGGVKPPDVAQPKAEPFGHEHHDEHGKHKR